MNLFDLARKQLIKENAEITMSSVLERAIELRRELDYKECLKQRTANRKFQRKNKITKSL